MMWDLAFEMFGLEWSFLSHRPVLNTRSYHHVPSAHPDPGENIIQIIFKTEGIFASFLQTCCCSNLSRLLCEHFEDVPGPGWVTLASAAN